MVSSVFYGNHSGCCVRTDLDRASGNSMRKLLQGLGQGWRALGFE